MAKAGRPYRFNNPISLARRKWLLELGVSEKVIKRNNLDRPELSSLAFFVLLNQVTKRWEYF